MILHRLEVQFLRLHNLCCVDVPCLRWPHVNSSWSLSYWSMRHCVVHQAEIWNLNYSVWKCFYSLTCLLVVTWYIFFFFYYETKSTFNFIFEKVLMVVKYTWHKLTTFTTSECESSSTLLYNHHHHRPSTELPPPKTETTPADARQTAALPASLPLLWQPVPLGIS